MGGEQVILPPRFLMKITKTLIAALLFGMAVSSFGTAVAADKSNATSGSSWYDNV